MVLQTRSVLSVLSVLSVGPPVRHVRPSVGHPHRVVQQLGGEVGAAARTLPIPKLQAEDRQRVKSESFETTVNPFSAAYCHTIASLARCSPTRRTCCVLGKRSAR